MLKQKVRDPGNHFNESPGPDLLIHPMSLQDLEEVLRIEKACFRTPWSRGQFLDEIERNPISFPYVLKHKKNVVAYCVCWLIKDELHINNLAVDPDHRRQGYAMILMRLALDFGKTCGCRMATLEVRTTNAPALQLYQQLGFQILGIIPGYYEDTGEDAFILYKRWEA
ncbi:MAG TPA: ribosomal protein S18-alanine N-acetyltransferase [Acidobacteriota bacterium]|nr:ribosomal protein S18-alanine N-acetyltransferase [Acidobacteriota bacterium]